MQIDSKSSQSNPQNNEKNLHNLQSESASPQQKIIKGRDKNYKIPTVINGRVSEETSEMLWGKRSPIPRERVPKSQNAKQIYTHNNILLLGDSHIKDLAEGMSISLGSSFHVSCFSKPNANIKEIISPSNSSYVNLTKQDMIIFCGGTRDISRNDSKSGLRTLLEFVKRTSATNVILLEAPIRYDLPPSSCVNSEVKLFIKRMRGLMTPFAHIKIMNMSTERSHHTRHGLHLTKKAKNWLVDNLVRELRKPQHQLEINSPIVTHWKDAEDRTFQQTNAGSPTRIHDDTKSLSPGKMRRNERRKEDMVMSPNGPSHQPTHTQQQTQLDPPQQYLLLGKQATEAQHKNLTSQLYHNTRTGSPEGKGSSEKSNQPQEV